MHLYFLLVFVLEFVKLLHVMFEFIHIIFSVLTCCCNSPTVAMVSRSSRQYIRLFGAASPAELLALLLLSFRELLSPFSPTFALEDAIVIVTFGSIWLFWLINIQRVAVGVHVRHIWQQAVIFISSSLSSFAAQPRMESPSTEERVSRRRTSR